MQRPLIIGNWKMNGTLAESNTLIRQLCVLLGETEGVDACICPPFTLLQHTRGLIEGTAIALGAQNAHHAAKGPFTGEISMPMIQELGCEYVILGHSERRLHCGEDDALIARKVESAQSLGVTPVLCVGESIQVRDRGEGEAYVLAQVRNCLTNSSPEALVIAYEPIWAIGTGRAATAQQAEQMLRAIRQTLIEIYGEQGRSVRLLYGGSVTAANIRELVSVECIDGALVGGASLKAEEFAHIVRQVGTSSNV